MLVPTRELALQTSAVVRELGKHMHIECMVSTGGTSLKDDIMRLYNTVHILVGTPGRILDLASKGVANLTQCKTVIMDEARTLLWMCSSERKKTARHRQQPTPIPVPGSLSVAGYCTFLTVALHPAYLLPGGQAPLA